MGNQTLIEAFSETISTSEGIMNYVPEIILATILLLVGFLVGKLAKHFIIKIGEVTGFDNISKSTDKILRRFGYRKSTMEFIGELSKWVIFLFFVGITMQYVFGEQILTETLTSIAVYFPKVILAAIIIIIGIILSDVFGNLAKGLAENLFPKLKDKNLISFFSGGITKLMVFLISIIIALDVLGIYVEVFTAAFAIILISISLIIIIGSRDLFLNAFAGIYIQSTGNLRKGMEIEFENKKGKIKEIGLIQTVIEINKEEIQIPNHLFMKKICTIR